MTSPPSSLVLASAVALLAGLCFAAPAAPAGDNAVATVTCDGSRAHCRPGDVFQDCPGCPQVVVVPPGSYLMGSPDGEVERAPTEGPQHLVIIGAAFAVGRTEITFEDWDTCSADGGCSFRPKDVGWGRGRRPVINVSWRDINDQYLPWLARKSGHTYRLLSEAEWEYCARAGSSEAFHTGKTITTEAANFDGTGTYGGSARGLYRKRTVEAGSFPPNAFGIHDMSGNVAEWVADCYADSYAGAGTDGAVAPELPDCQRVLRGGSWIDVPRAVRSAYRGHLPATARFIFRGFRVARDLTD